jgi:hypothetical protein
MRRDNNMQQMMQRYPAVLSGAYVRKPASALAGTGFERISIEQL